MAMHESLSDLMEISSQIVAAVVLDDAGEPLASTLDDEGRTAELARAARELLAAAERVRPSGAAPLAQLDAATRDGSVFVVRAAPLAIAATTSPSPTVGLVFYDLKTCLRAYAAAEEAKPKRKPRARRKQEEAGDAAP